MDGSQPNVETSRRRSAPAALEAAGAALAVVREVHARGEAGTRSRSHSTPSLRSGSVAGSSQRGSPSKRGGSKRSPSKSCGMGDVFSRQAASQEVVLRALVRSFTVEQSVHDVAVNLLGQIHSKEGAIAFTRESISQAVTASEASMSMLPIAHGLLDEGHVVSFLAHDETVRKIEKLVPKAKMVDIGPSSMDREKGAAALDFLQSTSYRTAQFLTSVTMPLLNVLMGGPMLLKLKPPLQEMKPDVLCVPYIYPAFYALGEALEIPVVGIGWGTPSWLTVQIDLPWATEPNVGSIHSRQELYDSPLLLLENTAVRIHGFFIERIASMINMYFRYQLGHPRPLEVWQFDAVSQHPAVITTLPELTAGRPTAWSPFTFPVGILDHPGLEGSGMMKSDDKEKVMAWLDEQQLVSRQVLYVAFGSEVRLSREDATLLVETFKQGGFTVLWASKVKPDVPIPENVLVTKFAPQRAVLSHPAVFGFLSHGGMNSVNEALASGKPLAIMPFFADQMTVAVVHRDLGVAVILDKHAATPQTSVAAIRKIATEPFRRRSMEIKELNEQRRDMSRAVQVIVNQATGKFYMHIPPCPSLWIRAIPLFVTLLFLTFCCNFCCCISVHVHEPCWCCCRGRSVRPNAASGKEKRQ
ncbi:UGT2B17 [Symbiodinium microadriaticum]|nr:UGT2B17 [Symbiodinium microadriaticum]